MNRLLYNYFVRSEINNFYSSLSKINIENIHTVRAKYFDLNRKLINVDFIFFDSRLKHRLKEQLNAVRKKIIEVELEEELTSASVKFESLKQII
jgi:hypothetical protein